MMRPSLAATIYIMQTALKKDDPKSHRILSSFPYNNDSGSRHLDTSSLSFSYTRYYARRFFPSYSAFAGHRHPARYRQYRIDHEKSRQARWFRSRCQRSRIRSMHLSLRKLSSTIDAAINDADRTSFDRDKPLTRATSIPSTDPAA